MKKKIAGLTMVLMSLCVVGGCGKKEVTPEELINEYNLTQESVQCDFDVAVSVTSDLGSTFGGGTGETTDDNLTLENESTEVQAEDSSIDSSDASKNTMQVDMNFKGTVKVGDNGNAELGGNLDMTLFGFNQSVPYKGYLEKTESGYTSYISYEDNKYEKSDMEGSNLGSDLNIDKSLIENLTLNDTEKDIYKVTGSVNFKKLINSLKDNPLFKDSFNDEEATKSLDELQDFNINLNWGFNKESKKLKTLDFSIDENTDLKAVTIKTLLVKMSFSDYSGNIDIPQDIKDNAISSSDFGSSEFPLNEDSSTEDSLEDDSFSSEEDMSYEEMDSVIADEINNSLQSEIIE